MITIHEEVEQGSDQWLEMRQGKYTGSNAQKLLGNSQKTKYVNGGSLPYAASAKDSFTGNYHTKRGHLLEDEAIELYEKINNVRVNRPGFITNSNFPNAGYSPDAILDERTIEVKAFAETKHLKMVKGDIPLPVLAQVHFGMLVCEKNECDLVMYNPDVEDPKLAFNVKNIKSDSRIVENFRKALAL